MCNDSRLCMEQHTSILLSGLKECETLEWLTLVGFPFVRQDESDEESRDGEEGDLEGRLGAPSKATFISPPRSFELLAGWSCGVRTWNHCDLVLRIKTIGLHDERFEYD
jgi:hypothetical protein